MKTVTSLTLRIRKPWWWGPAVWLSAIPLILKALMTDKGPADEEAEAFAARWAKWLQFEVVEA